MTIVFPLCCIKIEAVGSDLRVFFFKLGVLFQYINGNALCLVALKVSYSYSTGDKFWEMTGKCFCVLVLETVDSYGFMTDFARLHSLLLT